MCCSNDVNALNLYDYHDVVDLSVNVLCCYLRMHVNTLFFLLGWLKLNLTLLLDQLRLALGDEHWL